MIKDYNNKYNKEPIHYCKGCGSLHIIADKNDYCFDCSSSNIGKTTIEVWEEWYKQTYNKDYVSSGKH